MADVTQVIMCDDQLSGVLAGHAGGGFWEQTCATVGSHDDDSGDVHLHWSVLTIKNGVVLDVDWGYHSDEEAEAVIRKED